MPNGTYGGVRGRKTKVGGKLTTFVFLLLDFFLCFLRRRLRTPPTPPRPKEVAAELPNDLENAFDGHRVKMSSGPNGSYFPSFISNNTEPLSSARTVCHCPVSFPDLG